MTDTDTTPVTGGSSSTDQAHAGQPAYAQPQVFAQPAPPIYIIQKPPATKKGFGLTSMILGISAVLFSWTTVFAFILLILAFARFRRGAARDPLRRRHCVALRCRERWVVLLARCIADVPRGRQG